MLRFQAGPHDLLAFSQRNREIWTGVPDTSSDICNVACMR